MSTGELVTRWTIRGSLMLYAAVVTGHLVCPLGRLAPGHTWRIVARGLWTLGCVSLLLHVAAAFHYYHGWSHDAAIEDTARQTQAALGTPFGGGLYFNYLFAGLWLADVGWWWAAPASYERRSRWVTAAVHGYLLFIAINATIVFESGAVRAAGLALCVVWSLLVIRRVRQPARKVV